MPASAPADITDDAALGGRLRLLQPRKGHRFGHDAILLAAAVPARAGEVAIDLGAGVGCAGLALAARVPGVRIMLAEIDPALTGLAAQNAQRNAMADRLSALTLDVTAPAEAFMHAGLAQGSADHVLMNPPFYDAARVQASPDAARRAAHLAQENSFSAWVRTAAWLLRPGGVLTAIYRADARDEVLAALVPEFGAVRVLPVYPKPDAAAIRLVVQAVRGMRGGIENCAGLRLNDEAGRPSQEAETILREASPLVFVPTAADR
jgi:tRNA1(Val) A37 N6-methylase TrmN6